MTENSRSSLNQIEVILGTLQEASGKISQAIENIGEISEIQAQQSQKVSETMQKIHVMSERLVQLASEI